VSVKRLTGRQAIAAWPDRLAAVEAEPTDENLQRLCSLLDAIDRWVVQRWGGVGHDARMAELAARRSEARAANHQVSTAARARQAAAGTANLARRAQRGRTASPAGLRSRSGSSTPATAPGAAGASRAGQERTLLDGHDGPAVPAPGHAHSSAPALFLETPQSVDRDPADCVVIARRHGVASAGRKRIGPSPHEFSGVDAALLEPLGTLAGDVVAHVPERIVHTPATTP
jgi:hypothetical protein